LIYENGKLLRGVTRGDGRPAKTLRERPHDPLDSVKNSEPPSRKCLTCARSLYEPERFRQVQQRPGKTWTGNLRQSPKRPPRAPCARKTPHYCFTSVAFMAHSFGVAEGLRGRRNTIPESLRADGLAASQLAQRCDNIMDSMRHCGLWSVSATASSMTSTAR